DPLTPAFIIKLVLIVGISSFGVAGVGGGATFAALIVLSSMGLPVDLAGILISIEALIDMGRTALNVNDSMLSGTLTSRIMGKLNLNTYNDQTAVENDVALEATSQALVQQRTNCARATRVVRCCRAKRRF